MALKDLLSIDIPALQTPEGRELVERAYTFAQKAHAGQKRKSGEPYFTHLEATATICAGWRIDATTIAAALLHDVLEDTNITEQQMTKEFGEEITFLVQGVTKISHIKYRGNEAQAETLKKMILALSQDIRVVFVKLADRTHNMRTLRHLPQEKRIRIAQETADIYAPLAYRLGLTTVSGELEDLAFEYLHPEDYKLLKKLVRDHLQNGERYMEGVKKELTALLEEHKIPVLKIDSRVKRMSSLFKKLRRHEMNLDKIYDLIALRVIVKNVDECYATLGTVHTKWPPLPGMIKDYIALPKPNGYRSLHTTVICTGKNPTEIQIRTEEMHYENEFGIAAYWAYNEAKKNVVKQATFASERQLAWINQLKDWQDKRDEPDEFINSLKIDFFSDRIFCITPKGEAIDLPLGATPVDFAYAIHSQVGDRCMGAKVNNRMVQLDTELQSGDVVEIITQKNKRPNSAWLNFVKTRHARNRIRAEIRNSNPVQPKPIIYTLSVSNDRVGILKDITTVFSQQRVNILGHESTPPKVEGTITIRITAGPEAHAKSDQLALRLRTIPSINRVEYKKIP